MKFVTPSLLAAGVLVSGCSAGNQEELESLQAEETSFRNRATIALETKSRTDGEIERLREEIKKSPADALKTEVEAAEKRVREMEAELAKHLEKLALAEKFQDTLKGRER